MRLTDWEILRLMDTHKILFNPAVEAERVSGVTVDLKLGNKFRKATSDTGAIVLASQKPVMQRLVANAFTPEYESELLALEPGEMALGITLEHVTIPDNIVGWLDGRSTLARLGLLVHLTAHRIDPGWQGNIVLEFYNASHRTLILTPGMSIGAISFEQLRGDVLHPYRSRVNSTYKNQTGAVLAGGDNVSEDNSSR